jgi:hypothetical protein
VRQRRTHERVWEANGDGSLGEPYGHQPHRIKARKTNGEEKRPCNR